MICDPCIWKSAILPDAWGLSIIRPEALRAYPLHMCGLISQHNATALPDGPDRMTKLMGQNLRKRMTMRGFIEFDDFGHLYPQFAKEMVIG